MPDLNTTPSFWISIIYQKACDWEGIECDKNFFLTAILLSDTNYVGTIPVELGELRTLQSFEMANNKIIGTIPRSLASLPELVRVDLSSNRINGTLPQFTSSKLEYINLGYNDLHGSIPKHLITKSGMTLMTLAMPQNRLSGTIPDTIQDWKVVEQVDFSNNILHGTLPPSIGKLSLLKELYLNNNFLVGSIPHEIASSHPVNSKMGDLLEVVHLQDNELSGTLPLSLEYLPLKEFLIHENKLTGHVPTQICSEDVNFFFFQDIAVTPDRNYCDAISCPSDTVALDGTAPCISCNNIHYNPYIGQTRMCNTVVNQRDILKNLFERTTENGGKWNGDNNWEDDDVFLCNFSGVTCDGNSHVTEINLKGRGLMGTIPESLGFLKNLEKLDLSDNELMGFLPSDLRWAPLEVLDISGNKIRGIVPPRLCLEAGINQNGEGGDFNCDHIVCPGGTYSPSGRRDPIKGHECLPCQYNNPEVLGMKSCRVKNITSGAFGMLTALFTLAIAAGFFVVLRMEKKSIKTDRMNAQEERMCQLEMQRPIAVGTDDSFRTECEMQATVADLRGGGSTRRREGGKISGERQVIPQFAVSPSGAPKGRKGYSKVAVQENEGGSAKSVSSTGRSVRSISSRSRASGTSDESSTNNRDMWLDVPRIT